MVIETDVGLLNNIVVSFNYILVLVLLILLNNIVVIVLCYLNF